MSGKTSVLERFLTQPRLVTDSTVLQDFVCSVMESPVHVVPSTPCLRTICYNTSTPSTDAVVPEMVTSQSPGLTNQDCVPGTPRPSSACLTPHTGTKDYWQESFFNQRATPFKTPTRIRTRSYAPSPADHLVPCTPEPSRTHLTPRRTPASVKAPEPSRTILTPTRTPATGRAPVPGRTHLTSRRTPVTVRTPVPSRTHLPPRRAPATGRAPVPSSPRTQTAYSNNENNLTPVSSCDKIRGTKRQHENRRRTARVRCVGHVTAQSRKALTELRRSPEASEVSTHVNKSPDFLDLI